MQTEEGLCKTNFAGGGGGGGGQIRKLGKPAGL